MRRPAPLGSGFSHLWLSTGSANLADGMALFSLPLMAHLSGASPAGVAAVTAALAGAWPVFGLHAGWIVDRVPRARLLSIANVVRALVLALLAVHSVLSEPQVWTLILAAALLGVSETLVDTALTSSVPLLVDKPLLHRANARMEATVNATNQLAGPVLAGALAAASVGLVAGASAALYLAAALLLAAKAMQPLRSRRPTVASSPAPVIGWAGLLAGVSFVWRQPLVRALTLFTAGMNVVWAAVTALLVVYAVAPGPLGLSPAAYGAMLSAMAVGGLVASGLTDWLVRNIGVGPTLLLDCVGTIMLSLPVALGAGVWVIGVGLVIAGAGSSVWRIIVGTIRQNLTPSDVLGRVYAASRTMSWGVLPVSAAAAGLAADATGVQSVFVAVSAFAVALCVAFAVFAHRTPLSELVPVASPHQSGVSQPTASPATPTTNA